MPLNKDEIDQLLEKYIQKRCNKSELASVLQLFDNPAYEKHLSSFMDRVKAKMETAETQPMRLSFAHVESYITEDKKNRKTTDRNRVFAWVAAASFVVITVGTVLRQHMIDNSEKATKQRILAKDIFPGTKKALLIQSDGSTTELSSEKSLRISSQGKLTEERQQEAQLIFEQPLASVQGVATNKQQHNTVKTPAGGEILVVLPDGTKAWLNAGSSLTFPTYFSEKERLVTLKGEAYFEVTNDSQRKFVVDVDRAKIVVLGTHFNINAYGDVDRIRTTLISGKIRVDRQHESVIVKKGQIAEIPKSEDLKVHVETSPYVDDAIAWKNGMFAFRNADLVEVMATIARWYDVEVIYKTTFRNIHFDGYISRTSTLQQVLEIMRLSGIHCAIEQDNLVVL